MSFVNMHWLISLISFVMFVSFTHARTLLPALDRRGDECKAGKPGCVSVYVMQPGTPDSPTWPAGPKTEYRYSSDNGCITKVTLLGGHATLSQVTSIAPDQGGHCLVYHSKDCQSDTGMPLNNPEHLDLRFPNKIIYPGVDWRMLPEDWIALKCYSHEAWE